MKAMDLTGSMGGKKGLNPGQLSPLCNACMAGSLWSPESQKTVWNPEEELLGAFLLVPTVEMSLGMVTNPFLILYTEK